MYGINCRQQFIGNTVRVLWDSQLRVSEKCCLYRFAERMKKKMNKIIDLITHIFKGLNVQQLSDLITYIRYTVTFLNC